MELVEGEDLSQRIARGAIPIDEALPIAKQIAEALEAAHEQGIIHRDLKPANIKVRADGTVKVLDFGLAKAMDPPAGSSPNVSQSPTITTPAMTQAGMILGTAAYMAPEQARGKTVDKRADIWAFGAVLYEMLTGRRAFTGEDVTDTIVSVISKEPDWSALPPATPAGLRRLLTRCLKKDAKTRLQAIGDARVQLDELLSGALEDAGSATTVDATSSGASGRQAWKAAFAVAAAVIAALAVPAVRYLRQTPPAAPPEMRLDITTPATDQPESFALSPDGRSIVFVARGDGPSRLWLRPLDQAEARPLAGTEGATDPFWSPDSRSIGFFAKGKLLRVDVADGAQQEMATMLGTSVGGSWSADGTIVFSRQTTGPLWRVAAAEGEPVAVTQLDPPRQIGHRFPHFLPDGRQFLFYATGTPETAGIYLGSLDGGAPTRLTAADSAGQFLRPDWVMFVRQGTLVARRLDFAQKALTGDTFTLTDRVTLNARGASFAVSTAGLVAYRAGGGEARHLTWVDRTGKAMGVAAEPDEANMQSPEPSPDGRRVAIARAAQGNVDIWLLDLFRGGMTRRTTDAAGDINALWSPDGMRIAFSSNRTGVFDLYLKPSNGSGAEERLVASPNIKQAQDWSRDGRWLLYYEANPTTGRDLLALDMTSPDHTSRVVANTPAEEVLAQFSPDGRWVAYQTNESERFEVVVQPFPDAGGKWQVSTNGGAAPRWRADGKEIYYRRPTRR